MQSILFFINSVSKICDWSATGLHYEPERLVCIKLDDVREHVIRYLFLVSIFTRVGLASSCCVIGCLGSLVGVRNEADAKLLSEKQRQVADLQNQLKSLVSWCCVL